VEASLVKLLQPKFTPDPNLSSSSIDRGDVAHLKIIARTESTDPVAIQNRQLALRITEPHAAQAIGERSKVYILIFGKSVRPP
jgi:hypothetical protein